MSFLALFLNPVVLLLLVPVGLATVVPPNVFVIVNVG